MMYGIFAGTSPGSATHTWASVISAQSHRHTSAAFCMAVRLEEWGDHHGAVDGVDHPGPPWGAPAAFPGPLFGVCLYAETLRRVYSPAHAFTAHSQRSRASSTASV